MNDYEALQRSVEELRRIAMRSNLVIMVSAWVPEFTPVAVEDYEDRLAAMTVHHLDLSLLPLTEPSRVVFEIDGKLVAHPTTIKCLKSPESRTHSPFLLTFDDDTASSR